MNTKELKIPAFKPVKLAELIIIATPSQDKERLLKSVLSACGFKKIQCFRSRSELSIADLSSQMYVLLLDETLVRDWYSEQIVLEDRGVSRSLQLIIVGKEKSNIEKHSLLEAGARGYVTLPQDIPFIPRAIAEVSAGGLWFGRSVLVETIRRKSNVRRQWTGRELNSVYSILTRREKTIALCVSKGLRNREIAASLCISEKTVKLHITNIYRKLKVSTRLQLGLFLAENEPLLISQKCRLQTDA
ncbi:MAG: response regulator transcription factor [Sulfuricaulis sp.]